uniref:Ovo-like zinc finger 1b n=1 Tax=Paramormyrops kingsleyae TaxID=1676925 RepID=A0A3B3RXJ9_9TELE
MKSADDFSYGRLKAGLPHGIEQSEASPAESTWRESHDKHTQIRECDLRLQAAELPACSALGQRAPGHEDGTGSQEVFLRTKIKVTTGKLPVTETPSPAPAALASSPAGTPALVCQVCHKGFQQQRMLKRHLKCHSDIKRHPCSYCGKGFNDTFDLKRHIRTHTGERLTVTFRNTHLSCPPSHTQRYSSLTSARTLIRHAPLFMSAESHESLGDAGRKLVNRLGCQQRTDILSICNQYLSLPSLTY